MRHVAHKVMSIGKAVVNKATAVEAVTPYAAYYILYRTQGSLSHHLPGFVNDWMTATEIELLMVDMDLDRVKRATGSNEPDNDEGGNGGVCPLHIGGLDKNPGDPLHTYLPGVDVGSGNWEVGPNNYGWGKGWGDLPGKPNI